MAKKASQKRLTLPIDLWDLANFSKHDRCNFGFFIFKDSRVIILPIDLINFPNLECIGKCSFDEKHRFFIPKNVDAYLGKGDEYYFSIELSASQINNHFVYLYKADQSMLKVRQDYHFQKYLESLH